MKPLPGRLCGETAAAAGKVPAWGPPALACTLVVAYFLVYWQRLFFGARIPFDGNTVRLFYPSWVVGRQLLLQGFHLLWDPARNMGQPFLADPQNQALYPLSFLSPFVNFLDYQRLFVACHFLVAAIPAYLLGRKLFTDNRAALFAALIVGFNGFVLARVTLAPHFATLAWVPAAVYFLDREKPLALGAVLALQWLAGFPPFFLLTTVLLLVYSFAQDQPRRSLVCLAGGLVLMAGLSAAQWVPFVEMLRASNRPVLLPAQEAIVFSLHPMDLVRQLTLPSFLLNSLEPVSTCDPAMVRFYFGPVSLALVLWGAVRGGRRERMLCAAAIAAFTLALGQYNGFYARIPFMSVFRFPSHWLMLTTFAFAFVGARGLREIRNGNLRWVVFGLAALDILLAAMPYRSLWGSLEFFTRTPNSIRALGDVPAGSRVFHSFSVTDRAHEWPVASGADWEGVKSVLLPSIGVAYGIREASSYSVLMTKRQLAFLGRLTYSPPTSVLFDYAGISRIVTLDRTRAPGAAPSWRDCRVVENSDFKPPVFMDTGKPVRVAGAGPADVTVEAEGPGRLIFSQAFFPGWVAIVDGERRPPSIFEEALLSCDVPSGSHRVRFVYQPLSWFIGLGISALALLLAIGWSFRRHPPR